MRQSAVVMLVRSGCFQPVDVVSTGPTTAVGSQPSDGGGLVDAGLPDAGPRDSGVVNDAGQPVLDAGFELDAGSQLVGRAFPECGPTDGAGWQLELSTQQRDCGDPRSGEGFFVSLWFDPLQPGSSSLGTSGALTQACFCGGVADYAHSGTVRLESVTATEISGRIDAAFTSSVEHVRFRVRVCPGSPACG